MGGHYEGLLEDLCCEEQGKIEHSIGDHPLSDAADKTS